MKRVMVVDDVAFMRLTLSQTLTRLGYEVVAEAKDGLDAILKYKMYKPSIVTMDITMPNMNGIEAVQEIKKINKDAKIIMISAMGNIFSVREAIEAGASGYIIKPFNDNDILKKFSQHAY